VSGGGVRHVACVEVVARQAAGQRAVRRAVVQVVWYVEVAVCGGGVQVCACEAVCAGRSVGR